LLRQLTQRTFGDDACVWEQSDFIHQKAQLVVHLGRRMQQRQITLPDDAYTDWIKALSSVGHTSLLWQHWRQQSHQSNLPVLASQSMITSSRHRLFLTAFRRQQSTPLFAEFVHALGHLPEPSPFMAGAMVNLLDMVKHREDLTITLTSPLLPQQGRLATPAPSVFQHVLYSTIQLATSSRSEPTSGYIGLGLAPDYREALESSLLQLSRRIAATEHHDDARTRRVVSQCMRDLDCSIRAIQSGTDISDAIAALDSIKK
jgi:hypothetical protein